MRSQLNSVIAGVLENRSQVSYPTVWLRHHQWKVVLFYIIIFFFDIHPKRHPKKLVQLRSNFLVRTCPSPTRGNAVLAIGLLWLVTSQSRTVKDSWGPRGWVDCRNSSLFTFSKRFNLTFKRTSPKTQWPKIQFVNTLFINCNTHLNHKGLVEFWIPVVHYQFSCVRPAFVQRWIAGCYLYLEKCRKE